MESSGSELASAKINYPSQSVPKELFSRLFVICPSSSKPQLCPPWNYIGKLFLSACLHFLPPSKVLICNIRCEYCHQERAESECGTVIRSHGRVNNNDDANEQEQQEYTEKDDAPVQGLVDADAPSHNALPAHRRSPQFLAELFRKDAFPEHVQVRSWLEQMCQWNVSKLDIVHWHRFVQVALGNYLRGGREVSSFEPCRATSLSNGNELELRAG